MALKYYSQYYRSGTTMKQKVSQDKLIQQDKRQNEQDRLNSNKPGMGKND